MKFESREQLEALFERQCMKRWQIAQTTAQERIAKLKKLREALVRRQDEFYTAVWEDFHKPQLEAWLCEVFPTIEEIDEATGNLKRWMRDRPAKGTFFLPTSKSCSHFEPKGRVLIFAPWNYPLLLLVEPIVSAIAAGNVVIAKPSHKTPRVSAFLTSLFEEIFPHDEVAILEGPGTQMGDELLRLPFDHVFFTGSPQVGAHVGQMSQKVHAGLTLELGGKSPVVVLPEVDLKDAARKLSWGKTLNAGQTCVAPDYVLCPRQLVEPLAQALCDEIKLRFGETEEARRTNDDLVHIIDRRACERHQALMDNAIAQGAHPHLGGTCDIDNRITSPTVLTGVTPDMDIMQSEIFGPILPIIAYDELSEAIAFIQNRPKPLALYVFGTSKKAIRTVLSQTTSGSTCVNHSIIQIENLSVPFGGVGMSGVGNYHGIYGFRTFSHERNVMSQGSFDATSFFFQPYHRRDDVSTRGKIQRLVEKCLRWIARM